MQSKLSETTTLLFAKCFENRMRKFIYKIFIQKLYTAFLMFPYTQVWRKRKHCKVTSK